MSPLMDQEVQTNRPLLSPQKRLLLSLIFSTKIGNSQRRRARTREISPDRPFFPLRQARSRRRRQLFLLPFGSGARASLSPLAAFSFCFWKGGRGTKRGEVLIAPVATAAAAAAEGGGERKRGRSLRVRGDGKGGWPLKRDWRIWIGFVVGCH